MRSFALTFIYLNFFTLAASEEVSNASAQDNDCKHGACHVSGQSLLQHKIFDDVATKDEELDLTLDERSLIAHRSDKCDIGCASANCPDGKCSLCHANYGVHPAGKIAQKCKPCSVTAHCSYCAYRRRNTMCKDCNPGYVLQLNGRYIEGHELQAALLNKAGPTTYCEACAANCYDCTAPGTCTKCNGGYVVNPSTSRCDKCAYSCKTCQTAATCSECKAGYVLNPSTSRCDKCASNCKTCQTAATCSECRGGYVLAALVNGTAPNGKWCDKCSANCFKCDTNGAGLCDVCHGSNSLYERTYELDPTTKLCVEETSSLR